MFITKKHLHRRTFLRGAGVAMGLPLLDAMVPASTALANTAAAPHPRMGFIYFPHGAVMNRWTPKAEGADFDLPPIIEALKPFQDRLTIVSGLDNKPAVAPPVHAVVPGTWLNCVSPRISHEPYGGTTADQIAAQQIGQDTPFPSLEVATEERGGEGACDRNYGCSYGRTISFRNPSTPLPMEHNPRNLFQRMFGQGDTAEERDAILRQNASLLDLVREEAGQLGRRLSPRDRVMLSNYLDSVREIERRIEGMEAQDLAHLELPEAPAGIPDSFDERLRLMFDLMALAYQADLTRIVSFMMAAEVSQQSYNHIGISDAFHPLSHHQENEERMIRLSRIQTYHTEVFADFLEKLDAMPDGEGSVLDNSILLYGSNMSNSNRHDHFPLPNAVLGGGAGSLKGNQHLRYPDHTPVANLLVTLLDRAGVHVESLGDSTGELAEI